jgi:hypothetical protein
MNLSMVVRNFDRDPIGFFQVERVFADDRVNRYLETIGQQNAKGLIAFCREGYPEIPPWPWCIRLPASARKKLDA